uniref:Uncharacterized protein n=1 Tax=Poecilia mexicana TaxID=48701 RepID=A0A3B3XZM5_9TELE
MCSYDISVVFPHVSVLFCNFFAGRSSVLYQVMPAIGADGKDIMKLIPVHRSNGQPPPTQQNVGQSYLTQTHVQVINGQSFPAQTPVLRTTGLSHPTLTPVQLLNAQFFPTQIPPTPLHRRNLKSMFYFFLNQWKAWIYHWEINIPVEAEVKTVPLKNLPNSVIRRIGLPVSEGDSARKQSDSTDVTWICPVVVRRKGQESVSGSGRHLADNLLPFVGTQVPASPLKMSFVSSNRAARDVLKNISPGRRSSKEEFLSQDTALLANDDAVVVYKGQIYLCIRKAKRRTRRTRKQQPVCQAAMPSTSGQPSTTHNRVN